MSPQPTPPSPSVIPAEGVAQVFADEGCTQYYDGSQTNHVFVRVNRAFGYGEDFVTPSDPVSGHIQIAGPSSEFPEDQFGISVYVDYTSDQLGTNIDAGTVVECSTLETVTITDPVTIFYES